MSIALDRHDARAEDTVSDAATAISFMVQRDINSVTVVISIAYVLLLNRECRERRKEKKRRGMMLGMRGLNKHSYHT